MDTGHEVLTKHPMGPENGGRRSARVEMRVGVDVRVGVDMLVMVGGREGWIFNPSYDFALINYPIQLSIVSQFVRKTWRDLYLRFIH